MQTDNLNLPLIQPTDNPSDYPAVQNDAMQKIDAAVGNIAIILSSVVEGI
jgi:hypothetical protein